MNGAPRFPAAAPEISNPNFYTYYDPALPDTNIGSITLASRCALGPSGPVNETCRIDPAMVSLPRRN